MMTKITLNFTEEIANKLKSLFTSTQSPVDVAKKIVEDGIKKGKFFGR